MATRDAFSATAAPPAWSVEHAEFSRPWRLVRGVLMSLRPGVLWARLTLGHELVAWRLWAALVGAYATVHVLTIGLAAFGRYRAAAQFGLRANWEGVYVWPYFEPVQLNVARGTSWPMATAPNVGLVLPLVPVLVVLMLVLGETMSRVRVKRLHLLRGAAYASWGVLMVSLACAGVLTFGGVLLVYARMVLSGRGWAVAAPALQAIDELERVGLVVLVFAPGLWLWLWWRVYVRDYLKLPRAGVVAAVMTCTAALATATLWAVLAAV